MATPLAHCGFWGCTRDGGGPSWSRAAGLVVLRWRFRWKASVGVCPLGVPCFWSTQSVPHSVLGVSYPSSLVVSTQPCDEKLSLALSCAWLEGSHKGQLLPWEGPEGLFSPQTGVETGQGDGRWPPRWQRAQPSWCSGLWPGSSDGVGQWSRANGGI